MKKLFMLSLILTSHIIVAESFTMPCLSKSNIKYYAQELARQEKKQTMIQRAALTAGIAITGLSAIDAVTSADPKLQNISHRLLYFFRDCSWGFISTAFGFYTVYSLDTIAEDSYAYFKEQTKIELLRQTLKYYANQLAKSTVTPQQQDYYRKQIVLTCNRMNTELEKLCGYFIFSKLPDAALQDMTATFYQSLEDALNNPATSAADLSEIIDDFYYNLGNILYDAQS